MPESITVHVNRSERGAIEVDRPSIETDRAFEVRVKNHGEPLHLFVRASDEIAEALTVEETNPYVAAGDSTVVPVTVHAHSGPSTGAVRLETGFGANATDVAVTLTGGVGDDHRVDVDERLATPATDEDMDGSTVDALFSGVGVDGLAVGGLVALALLVGTATAATIRGPVGALSLVLVLGGIAVGLALLLRDRVDTENQSE
ncbi:DUF7524 family protein [Halovivax cerinus]|uniref:CARDB domain-containing protein n=1 Tax=Halovivax cerinus TaxID=1487865 RepID=A0ABD5NIN0_9EURY|nr:hypothetical protein [Halovivax cerinus]